jgi:hypothetical protein
MSITVKELYDATMRGEGALAKHAAANPNMPVFLLLGQDQHAADLVEKWAIWASVDDRSVKSGKVSEAREITEQMRRWPIHKAPD